MGRTRLAGLIFGSLALLLCVSQEAAAQFSKTSVKSDGAKNEPSIITRSHCPDLGPPRVGPRFSIAKRRTLPAGRHRILFPSPTFAIYSFLWFGQV